MTMSLHMLVSSPSQHHLLLKPHNNPLYTASRKTKPLISLTRTTTKTKALLSTTKEAVLKDFYHQKALKGGATHVDIACDPELVKLAVSLTSLPVCVSSVDPSAFLAAVEAGATMILKLTKETKQILPNMTLSVTVPHTLSLPEQAKLAELLQEEGADVIQTEGGKCSSPSKSGVLGNAHVSSSIFNLPSSEDPSYVFFWFKCCYSTNGHNSRAAGCCSAVNKLNDVVAMIAEVRSLADAMASSQKQADLDQEKVLRWL
ncbi:Uncharacterized protein RDABS01_007257 [Bienertia sinuspersici]